MRNNGYKLVVVVALVLAVVGMSVGFAAFTATLNISSTEVNINPNDDFNENVNYEGTITATVSGSRTDVTTVLADYEAEDSEYNLYYNVGTASDKTWSGIEISAKEAFDLLLVATVENESNYTAYLHSVTGSDKIKCSYATGLTEENVLRICREDTDKDSTEFQVEVQVIGSAMQTKYPGDDAIDYTTASESIASKGTGVVNIHIRYNPTTSPSEPFTVTIPAIGFNFKTVENPNAG